MAPEVFRHEPYSETVDVYSYAMILFYLLDGKPPWPYLNGVIAVKKASEEGDRPPIPRNWDSRFQELLQECWDENPQARPPFSRILQVLNKYSRKYSMVQARDDLQLFHVHLTCLLMQVMSSIKIPRRSQQQEPRMVQKQVVLVLFFE